MNSSEARQLMDMLVDGDIRSEDVERLADYLTAHPDLVPELRADLRLTERLSQALCGARTAEAFGAMMETRMSAEESADKFTAGVMGRIPVRGEQVIRPSVWRRWLVPLAAAASVAIVAGVYWLNPAAGLGLRVVEVAGTATIEEGRLKIEDWKKGQGPEVRSQMARVGMELRQGDRVVVGKGGKAVLKYDGEETTAVLHSGTAIFRLVRGAKRVALDSGLLVCSVAPQKKPFLLETAHAVAEVVGTRFSLAENRVQTTLAVQEGRADLHQKDQHLPVNAGETAVADAAGMRKLSPADAWIRELLVRAETGSWDVVNLGTGVHSNDVWRMDARGGPAERRIWNMPVEASVASVVQLAEVRRPIRGVIACRMMIQPDGRRAPEVDGAQAVTNGAWRTSRLRSADMVRFWRDSRRGSLRLDYNLAGKDRYWSGDVPNADEHLTGVWHSFVVYVDTEAPDGIHFVYSAWPDGSVPSSASEWMAESDKGTVDDTVKIGLMAKGVLMEVQGLKFVPLGEDMPMPPRELLRRN